MEVLSLCSPTVALDSAMARPAVEATAVATSLALQKSLAWLLFAIGSLSNDVDLYLDPLGADKRFPLSELNRVKEPDAQNKDASETEDDDDDDDEEDEDDDEDDDDEEEEDDDDEGDSEDEVEANGHGGSDDDDEEEDEDDEGEDDDEEDEDDEDEDDEEDQSAPPSKKKK